MTIVTAVTCSETQLAPVGGASPTPERHVSPQTAAGTTTVRHLLFSRNFSLSSKCWTRLEDCHLALASMSPHCEEGSLLNDRGAKPALQCPQAPPTERISHLAEWSSHGPSGAPRLSAHVVPSSRHRVGRARGQGRGAAGSGGGRGRKDGGRQAILIRPGHVRATAVPYTRCGHPNSDLN